MKILWHYNSHRHMEEYSLSSEFFNRSDFLKKHAEVLVTYNNSGLNLEDLKNACNFECKFEVIRTTNPKNGVHTGQFVALNETFHLFQEYDFVIHTTPDVYLVNDKPLIKLLEEEAYSDNHMIVDYHPYHPGASQLYCTDFFVFKPRMIKNFFGDSFEPTEDCHCIEAHLFRSLHKYNIPHREICRGRSSLTWQIDDMGLIHNHNNAIIRDILQFDFVPDQRVAFSHNYVRK